MSYTLGLDVGTNSLGWAALNCDGNTRPIEFLDGGVRIFQEAVEAKTRTPKNHKRRQARAQRRLHQRRRQRREKLQNILLREGFLPPELATSLQPEKILNELDLYQGPYQLRATGLNTRLTEHQFGRVLLHLCSRRGFQSNRKSLFGNLADEFDDFNRIVEEAGFASNSDTAKEETETKAAIDALQQEITSNNCRTLGEYLATIRCNDASLPAAERTIRKRRTSRAMYTQEFEQLWQAQSMHHSSLNNPEFKAEVFDALFFQRPLKSQRGLVGNCSLEPRRKKAQRGRMEIQEFRLRQDINNLATLDPISGEFNWLSNEQKEALYSALCQQASMTWSKVRKLLGIHKGEQINLEESKTKLTGHRTHCDMQSKNRIGEEWNQWPEQKQLGLIEDLLTIIDKRTLVRRLQGHWKFNEATTLNLAIWEPEPGFASLSLKAINKLLPAMRDGSAYHEARISAGYAYDEITVRTYDLLPSPPEVRNPVVSRSLYEIRKVVNALIREHGKPSKIVVEMARDLKLAPKKLNELKQQQKKNQKSNEEAVQKIQEIGGKAYPGRDDRIKYRLWQECGGVCPYTLHAIPLETLFTDQIDVEHILPYSRTLDDSYMNKTLCYAEENRLRKRQQTPWEAYGGSERWEQIIQQNRSNKKLPMAKRKRFERKELDKIDDFIARQLNDTRHISVQTHQYLKALGCDVSVTKGGLTADLRHHWGLNNLLGETNRKDRSDHRHHLIDAAVIASTDRSLYRRLVTTSQKTNDHSPRQSGFNIQPPWPVFRDNLSDLVEQCIVSHAPNRKVSGALHEESALGLRNYESGPAYCKRVLLSDLTPSSLEKIADEQVKLIVKEHIKKFNSNIKNAFANQDEIAHSSGKSFIRSVRIKVKPGDSPAVLIRHGKHRQYGRYHNYGSNHHVEITRDSQSGTLDWHFVTLYEASQRLRPSPVSNRTPEPVVKTNHGCSAEFVMSLMINDMVELAQGEKRVICRVKSLSYNDIEFAEHVNASNSKGNQRIRLSSLKALTKAQIVKMDISPIGKHTG